MKFLTAALVALALMLTTTVKPARATDPTVTASFTIYYNIGNYAATKNFSSWGDGLVWHQNEGGDTGTFTGTITDGLGHFYTFSGTWTLTGTGIDISGSYRNILGVDATYPIVNVYASIIGTGVGGIHDYNGGGALSGTMYFN